MAGCLADNPERTLPKLFSLASSLLGGIDLFWPTLTGCPYGSGCQMKALGGLNSHGPCHQGAYKWGVQWTFLVNVVNLLAPSWLWWTEVPPEGSLCEHSICHVMGKGHLQFPMDAKAREASSPWKILESPELCFGRLTTHQSPLPACTVDTPTSTCPQLNALSPTPTHTLFLCEPRFGWVLCWASRLSLTWVLALTAWWERHT